MYRYKIVTGDYSHDGHSISETVYVETSINAKKLEELNEKLTAKLGFDFVEEVCSDYQQHYLSQKQYEAVSKFLGKEMDEYLFFDGGEVTLKDWKSSHEYYIEDGEHFIYVLFTLLQKIEPFDFKFVKNKTSALKFLNGAGYGLYSC